MEKITFEFDIKKESLQGNQRVACGVVGSGNLEVIIEKNDCSKVRFEIETSIENYQAIWQRVIQDFVKEYQPAGLKFIINDNGAIPPVVMLRLKQAFELFLGYKMTSKNYLELNARRRIAALVDEESFQEWLGNEEFYSPHLQALDIPCEADDGIIVGSATFNKNSILIAAQKKDFMGGGVGEIHGAKLAGLFEAAIHKKAKAVVLLIDSGGVRLHEANAGEIAISEIIRAVFKARNHGINTIGVVCGKNGAYGGMGIFSACLDYLLISEIGRIGVSGPEVIQAVKGIEAFDAQDRGLIWRVYGGKTRYLQQAAQYYINPDITEIRLTIQKILEKPSSIDLKSLKKQHALLHKRYILAENCQEEGEYLEKHFPHFSRHIFEMDKDSFLNAAENIQEEENHD